MNDSRYAIPPHYVTLGVAVDVTQEALTKQFRRLSMHLHPDRAAHTSKTPEQLHAEFQRVSEAYHVLSNPEQRVAYDVKHGVNFASRVSALKASIGRTVRGANTSTAQESSGAPTIITCAGGGYVSTDTPQLDDGEEEDEEEEYVVRPRSPSSSASSEEQEWTSSSANPPSAAEGGSAFVVNPSSRSREKRKRLWIQPLSRPVSATVSCNSSTGYEDAEQLKEVQMRREYHRETGKRHRSPTSTDLSWGIVLSNINTLMHARAPGIPFPSRIERWNSTIVDSYTDMPSILSKSISSSSTSSEEATMLLSFVTEQCELIGDIDSLQSQDVLQSLVGQDFSANTLSNDEERGDVDGETRLIDAALEDMCAELPGLLPGRSILAVNGQRVANALELLSALKRCAGSDDSRRCDSVVLDVSSIPRMP